jgi:hypothetical protein
MPPPREAAADDIRTFAIAWAVKGFGRTKRHIRLCDHDVPVYFTRGSVSSDVGQSWLITEQDIEATDAASALVCGQLSHEKRTRRWTFRERDVPGEGFGFAFYDLNGKKHSARAFRVVVPKEAARPYQSTAKENELSQLAKCGQVDDRFQLYSSKIPVKRNGVTVLDFGAVYVESSLKNFIMQDDDGRRIFVIYRSSGGTCTVKAALPITPLMAFALAIAIVTTES